MPAGAGLALPHGARSAYCGYGDAKKERIFGWLLHLICTAGGVPVASTLLPTSYHDLTPVRKPLYSLPAGAWVYADNADNSAQDEASLLDDTGVRRAPIHRATTPPHMVAERVGLRTFRRASKRSTARPRRWACSTCAPAPTPASISRSRPRAGLDLC